MDNDRKYADRLLRREYDVVVVGGGPAGAACARDLALAGVTVLMLDRKADVGVPVRCAEGVPRVKFESLVTPEPNWISAVVNGGMGHSPAGLTAHRDYPRVGYVLNREIADRALWARAAEAGAASLLRAEATAVRFAGTGAEVDVQCEGVVRTVTCRAVVGADGVESRVGRWVGIATALAPEDVDTCAEYILAGAEEPPDDYIHFFLGRSYAPGGYVWVFPKDGGRRHCVGVGVAPSLAEGRGPFYYLERFIARRYPAARVVARRWGVVPVAKPLAEVNRGCAVLVGDAARFPDPFSGEGICQALMSGREAARLLAAGLAEGDVPRALSGYREWWMATYGRRYQQHYKVRRVILSMTDDETDDTVAILRDKMDVAQIKSSEVFATFLKALWKNPKLLLRLRHLLE